MATFLLVWVLIALDQGSKGDLPLTPGKVVQGSRVSENPEDTFVFYEALEERNPDGSQLMPLLPDKEKGSVLPPEAPSTVPVQVEKEPTVKPLQGKYTVQVAAFNTQPAAQAMADRLSLKGYPAYLYSPRTSEKGLWYRVRVGRYSEREKALQMADRLKKEERLSGFVAVFEEAKR